MQGGVRGRLASKIRKQKKKCAPEKIQARISRQNKSSDQIFQIMNPCKPGSIDPSKLVGSPDSRPVGGVPDKSPSTGARFSPAPEGVNAFASVAS
jgi:hypothetical protein